MDSKKWSDGLTTTFVVVMGLIAILGVGLLSGFVYTLVIGYTHDVAVDAGLESIGAEGEANRTVNYSEIFYNMSTIWSNFVTNIASSLNTVTGLIPLIAIILIFGGAGFLAYKGYKKYKGGGDTSY